MQEKTKEQIAHQALHAEEKITAAEIYCANLISEELAKRGIKPNSYSWKMTVNRSADLLAAHREEIRSMYRSSKGLLRQWMLKNCGLDDMKIREKMQRIGLNGNPEHDFKLLQQLGGGRH